MTIYVYETMTQGDAASFTAADSLTFASNSATATQVTVAPYTNGQGGTNGDGSLGNSGISLTYNGKNLVFSDGLSQASQTFDSNGNGGIAFRDGSHLIIGTNGADDGESGTALTVPTTDSTASSVVYGLGGSDVINGGEGNNYLYGGTDGTSKANLAGTTLTAGDGGDTITAGDGNNHIYGNALTTQQGQADGNDNIIVGAGTNYINGNAGNDFIQVGVTAGGDTDASTGSNRVFGGGGNDVLVVRGAGVNALNGNMGDDYTYGYDATGNNTLRGGQGNDTIVSGHGHDAVFGDVGDDYIFAGTGSTVIASDGTVTYGHLTIMTGGTGADTFDFANIRDGGQGDAGTMSATNHTHSGIIVDGKAYYQTVTDFQQGTDTIHLFQTSGTVDIVKAQAGVTFTSVQAAEVYAQQLLDNHTLSTSTSGTTTTTAVGEVAAIDVNGNTYLFYHAAGGETGTNGIDSIIQLTGVSASTLSQAGTGTHTFS